MQFAFTCFTTLGLGAVPVGTLEIGLRLLRGRAHLGLLFRAAALNGTAQSKLPGQRGDHSWPFGITVVMSCCVMSCHVMLCHVMCVMSCYVGGMNRRQRRTQQQQQQGAFGGLSSLHQDVLPAPPVLVCYICTVGFVKLHMHQSAVVMSCHVVLCHVMSCCDMLCQNLCPSS